MQIGISEEARATQDNRERFILDDSTDASTIRTGAGTDDGPGSGVYNSARSVVSVRHFGQVSSSTSPPMSVRSGRSVSRLRDATPGAVSAITGNEAERPGAFSEPASLLGLSEVSLVSGLVRSVTSSSS